MLRTWEAYVSSWFLDYLRANQHHNHQANDLRLSLFSRPYKQLLYPLVILETRIARKAILTNDARSAQGVDLLANSQQLTPVTVVHR